VTSFSYEQIALAVGDDRVPDHPDDVQLVLLDRDARMGIGRSGSGAFVFVGPQQPAVASMVGTRVDFKPATDLRPVGSAERLDDVCILRFTPADTWEGLKPAVAAVFSGLASTGLVSPQDLGPAIHALRVLFEADLRSRVTREIEIGLAGELLAISVAADREALAERWHSAVDDTYDFSADGERLEIKTTSGVERVHWVTSSQVDGIPGVCTSFLSVLLPVIAHGTTVNDLFRSLTDLPVAAVARIRSVIVDTAGEPPELLVNVQFDLTAARMSLRHVPARLVPAPLPSPGVRRMRWEALFPERAESAPSCSFAALLGL
jgi:hypothetical protein